MADPLFDQSGFQGKTEENPVRTLFPEECSDTPTAAPLFPGETKEPDRGEEKHTTVGPLAFPERDVLPVSQTAQHSVLPVEPLTQPPAAAVPETVSVLMEPQPLDSPPRAPVPVQASAAFSAPQDPLVEKALGTLFQMFPHCSVSQQTHWKALLSSLFPLRAEGIASIGEAAISHAPQVLQEVVQETKTFTALDVSVKVRSIADQAKAAQSAPQKGFAALLSKVEGAIHPFDPQEAHSSLTGLLAALHALSGRAKPARDLAEGVMAQIQDDLPVLSVLHQMSAGTPSEMWVSRRQDLLQASLQQMQMALQQIENLETQIQSARASVEELQTITLPALGFLSAIQ